MSANILSFAFTCEIVLLLMQKKQHSVKDVCGNLSLLKTMHKKKKKS